MQTFERPTIKKITIAKKRIETKINIVIEIKGNRVTISGNEEDCYIGEKVLDAIDCGFDLDEALLLKETDYLFEQIPIKSLSRSKKLSVVKGRIIGKQGKTLLLLQNLSDSYVTLKNSNVNIIGRAEDIKIILNAVKSLISGAKQANVYSYLEKSRKNFYPEDLGLKEDFK